MLKGLWNYLKKYAKFANKQYIIKISTISVLTIIISIFTPACISGTKSLSFPKL